MGKDSLPFPSDRSSLAVQILSVIPKQSREKSSLEIMTFRLSHSFKKEITSQRLTAFPSIFQHCCTVPSKPGVLHRPDSFLYSDHPPWSQLGQSTAHISVSQIHTLFSTADSVLRA